MHNHRMAEKFKIVFHNGTESIRFSAEPVRISRVAMVFIKQIPWIALDKA